MDNLTISEKIKILKQYKKEIKLSKIDELKVEKAILKLELKQNEKNKEYSRRIEYSSKPSFFSQAIDELFDDCLDEYLDYKNDILENKIKKINKKIRLEKIKNRKK